MKTKIVLITLLFLISANFALGAWISVPDQGDSGWQAYSYQAGPDGFTGTAGFVVSNVIDNAAYSELLLDNLSQAGSSSNRSFEVGNYSGFSFLGNSSGEVSDSVIAFSGNVYGPTQGDYFSHLLGLGNGISTSAFQNASGQAGTSGSILETAVSLPANGIFTFDWAFLAGDLSPWNDFALFYLKDASGQIVFFDGLAQIGTIADPVPLPPSALLLGSGLLGLLGWTYKPFKRGPR